MFNLNSNQDHLITNQMLLSALVATSINPFYFEWILE